MSGGVEFIRSLTSAWECCASCAGGVLARHDRELKAEAWQEGARRGYALFDLRFAYVERENPYAAPTTDQPGRVSGDERGDQR